MQMDIQSTTMPPIVSPPSTGRDGRENNSLLTIVKAQIVFLMSTLTEDNFERNQTEIRTVSPFSVPGSGSSLSSKTEHPGPFLNSFLSPFDADSTTVLDSSPKPMASKPTSISSEDSSSPPSNASPHPPPLMTTILP